MRRRTFLKTMAAGGVWTIGAVQSQRAMGAPSRGQAYPRCREASET
ncbi:MAG: twin-arginine translocation signal domain-containing protein [Planctomycetes bacterium]|nr:twin-arginine translocation signal domain-containing protein [Planctomycetota bacterium]MBL7037070.1 twin-arginine translocation signal domain-containing protein [Pirellulaceae bacterium]